jgi:hypothetical protein
MKHLARAWQIVLATLREIFDEAAYARFLQRANLVPSREAYASFCRDRESNVARRHRCC